MAEKPKLIANLIHHIVDGQYLQDNDVEHENYVLVEDLDIWFGENPGVLAPTEADLMEFAQTGGYFRRNYYIYEKFVDVPSILEKIKE